MKIKSPLIIGISFTIALSGCSSTDIGHDNSEKSETHSAGNKESEVTTVETIQVTEKHLENTVHIPAELIAFRDVAIHPKVQGFVKSVAVDRGSAVRMGQVLIEIVAPELEANFQESRAKFETASSALLQAQSNVANFIAQQEEAQARVEAEEANYKRIQFAARTAGAVAPVDLEAAEKTLQGSKAHVRAAEQAVIGAKSELQVQKGRIRSAKQALISIGETKAYLTVRAPFDGTITERNVHEGSLVSSTASSTPMLRIQETAKLRLLVPVPEADISCIKQGEEMKFTVPAFIGKTFTGNIARISHGLERKTRTMIIELDVPNNSKELEPGMYAEVVWQMQRPYNTLFVPATAVVSANDKTFVIRVKSGKVDTVLISRGQTMGKEVEVVGDLQPGDQVVFQASEDIKPGSTVHTKLISQHEASKSYGHGEE